MFEQGMEPAAIAASLEIDEDAVKAAIVQMPSKGKAPATIEKAKSILAGYQETFAEKIAELAMGADNEAVQFSAAKFGLLLTSGHFDPKKNEENGGISVIQINNYIQQAAAAYAKQPGILDVSAERTEPPALAFSAN